MAGLKYDEKKQLCIDIINALTEDDNATWIDQVDGGYCSKCYCNVPMFRVAFEWQYVKTLYCPNCGRRMENNDGELEES